MRIHYHRRRQSNKPKGPIYRANEQIRVPEVRLIDDHGTFLGVMKTFDALKLAREHEADLVEVSPKEQPPVCKLLDFGTFKYQKAKEQQAQKAHAKKVDIKGVRLSVKMGIHDMDVRKKKALSFLEEGDKIKIEIRMRGREKAHGELAFKRIENFIKLLEETYTLTIEQKITRQAGNVSAIIGRKS